MRGRNPQLSITRKAMDIRRTEDERDVLKRKLRRTVEAEMESTQKLGCHRDAGRVRNGANLLLIYIRGSTSFVFPVPKDMD